MSKDERLDVYEFGARLIETRDLDPVYVLLDAAELPTRKLERWLLAYWCFYHMGTASWIVDNKTGYWPSMRLAAGSKDYPRCHERRHFRGENARKSVAYLEARGVDGLFGDIFLTCCKNGGSMSVENVMDTVQEWVGFGPWIAFKVADMLERLGLVPVVFDAGAMFLFDSPQKGAELMWDHYGNGNRPKQVGEWAVESLLTRLGTPRIDDLAPPRYERRLNAQEAETVLCKWKSHLNGKYEIGEDIEACRKGLLQFKECPTAARLLDVGRTVEFWNTI